MELRQLEAFEAIARTGSFRSAADELNLTQPAISSRVHVLEEMLGTQLFDRRGKVVQLTADGMEFLKLARQIVGLARKLKATAKGVEGHSGVVRIGVSNLLLPEQVAQMLELAHDYFEGRAVEIHLNTANQLHRLLVQRSLDLVFTGRVREPSVETRLMQTFPTLWVAGPTLKLPDKEVLEFADIAAIPIVTYASESTTFAYLRGLLESLGFRHHDTIACDSTAAILQLVEAGVGIGAAVGPRVYKAIVDGTLKPLNVSIHLPIAELHAYYPIGADPRVSSYIEAVDDLLRVTDDPVSQWYSQRPHS